MSALVSFLRKIGRPVRFSRLIGHVQQDGIVTNLISTTLLSGNICRVTGGVPLFGSMQLPRLSNITSVPVAIKNDTGSTFPVFAVSGETVNGGAAAFLLGPGTLSMFWPISSSNWIGRSY